ncbi:uncharacterized protein LOC133920944 isoform X3 [Phragmites australis]|uniref:uncharacterized protein LOC133920944 isoform X3 n=1 Tax=Phragmites australis TaxID=29695 RepID=UPI002D788A47|nr:uncharacterized protein LOC133920944 isoform X3 [Phragmites australis]
MSRGTSHRWTRSLLPRQRTLLAGSRTHRHHLGRSAARRSAQRLPGLQGRRVAMWWRATRACRRISGARPASTAVVEEKTCRAVVVPRFGGPEVLEVRKGLPVPDLKPREVLVRARAVSINPLDLRMRSGYGRSIFEPHLPLILGRDISGEVAATGTSASSFSIGQEVFGALHPTALRGTYADYAILPLDELTLKPSTLSHVEASAIPFAALTAWRALHGTARISEGQRVLVIGGGGAVGLAAVQLAVAVGCGVSATCGAQSIERVMGAGAEQAIDYTTELMVHVYMEKKEIPELTIHVYMEKKEISAKCQFAPLLYDAGELLDPLHLSCLLMLSFAQKSCNILADMCDALDT